MNYEGYVTSKQSLQHNHRYKILDIVFYICEHNNLLIRIEHSTSI